MTRAEKNCELALAAGQGDEAAMMELWKNNQGLIRRIAARYPNQHGVGYEDLLQSAWYGLNRAVRYFDPERAQFSTMLVKCVQRSCTIAVNGYKKHVDESVSLDTPLTDDPEDGTMRDLIEDESLVPASDLLEESEERHLLEEAVNRLREEDRAVIRALYFDRITVKEASVRLSVSVGRIKSREKRALDALRRDAALCRWCLYS